MHLIKHLLLSLVPVRCNKRAMIRLKQFRLRVRWSTLLSVYQGFALKSVRQLLKIRQLRGFLIEAGFLEVIDGVKLPTDSGEKLGITAVRRSSERGEYMQCLFGADAQRVCVELMTGWLRNSSGGL